MVSKINFLLNCLTDLRQRRIEVESIELSCGYFDEVLMELNTRYGFLNSPSSDRGVGIFGVPISFIYGDEKNKPFIFRLTQNQLSTPLPLLVRHTITADGDLIIINSYTELENNVNSLLYLKYLKHYMVKTPTQLKLNLGVEL